MSDVSSPSRWGAHLALAASMAIVGSYVGLSKLLVAVFPLFVLAWLRFAIAALAMAGWFRRGPGETRLDDRDRRLLFIESLFGNFLFTVCMLLGISRTSAVAAGVVMAALPAAVALLSWLVLGERVGRRTLGAIACAALGIALVSVGAPGAGGAVSAAGVLLLSGAVFCEAVYVVVGKRLTASVGPKRISAAINAWGLVLVMPFGAWQAMGFSFESVGALHWALLVGYSIAASMVTVWLWMTGLKSVPAAAAGVFTVLLPISTALVGIAFLDERPTPLQGAAFAFALMAVLLATWPAPRRATGPSGA